MQKEKTFCRKIDISIFGSNSSQSDFLKDFFLNPTLTIKIKNTDVDTSF
jgi:hypothetical protein